LKNTLSLKKKSKVLQ